MIQQLPGLSPEGLMSLVMVKRLLALFPEGLAKWVNPSGK